MGDLKDVINSSVITKNIWKNFQANLSELPSVRLGEKGDIVKTFPLIIELYPQDTKC